MSFDYKDFDYKKIAIAALLGFGVIFLFNKGRSSKKKDVPAIVLNAARVKSGSMSERKVFSGSLKAEKSINITAERSATIKSIRQDGESVKEGDLIMELFNDTEKSVVLSAEAVLLDERAKYERAVKLHGNKDTIISDADLSSKESSYKKAQADYQRAFSELSKMIFKAPFDGMLGLVKYNAGSVLPYNQEVAVFVSDGPLYAHFSVPEISKSDVKKGLEIDVYPDKQDAIPRTARIVAYEVQADATHSVAVKAKLEEVDEDLIPGQFVRISVPLGMKHNVVKAPEAAVRIQQGNAYVYKIENGKAGHSPVKIGIRDDGYVEIVDGLAEGDIVIIEVGDSISDGLKVQAQILGDKVE
ncbi:efflux RND transporter periplasmic adaptor subunit [Candidatus Cytomitobacter indipagum]|uniref:Efflux RND transporter periplasmic adaptor subunit n=1 Tax=Candidatus Cytomitobacter indipagum TaxID=2601575 RepID=A0A5C0UEY6_9PROT|nr:efflux RND transporter periplasmic adaptor subunit [Candidatus Cytomitobacter indipagum]QEK38270.1 efflux RND transporter periplasmic adaptor subunit [Candidatus Cytomitobacter indipagum]